MLLTQIACQRSESRILFWDVNIHSTASLYLRALQSVVAVVFSINESFRSCEQPGFQITPVATYGIAVTWRVFGL